MELRFTYDGSGLAPGHVEQGKFTIVCNGGEFEVNFTAIIEKPSVETSCGRVQKAGDGELYRGTPSFQITRFL